MRTYRKVRLDLRGFDPDILSAVLYSEGCLGIEESSDRHWTVYFPQDYSLERLFPALRSVNPGFEENQVAVTVLPEENWQERWREYFKPLRVTENVWVAPPWNRPKVGKDARVIIIDPRMAFGTGTHETTQLMMLAMVKYLKKGERVLDAGTGSGILAIFARKLGSGPVVAFDIDPEAIANATHNRQLNEVNEIDFRVGNENAVSENDFDLILANISREVLLNMLPGLESRLKPGGRLILSGLLETESALVREALAGRLRFLEQLQKNEWIAQVWRKGR